jgi:UDP:flavonoid glycosyltransferase YjiC (YdhE family)
LTADKLAQAITAAVSDREMRQRCSALGEQIRDEDGIGQAVQLIEQHTPHRSVTGVPTGAKSR